MNKPIKRFNAGREARRRARKAVGKLPRPQVIPDKREKELNQTIKKEMNQEEQ